MHICTEFDVQMTELRERRMSKNLTQQQAAERLGVSLRSYISYENEKRMLRLKKTSPDRARNDNAPILTTLPSDRSEPTRLGPSDGRHGK